ncbi:hypothetical protein L7F22_037224 [Adiantum nelumboides]|nr:hypothetical protein [Adiantum nelumboides]
MSVATQEPHSDLLIDSTNNDSSNEFVAGQASYQRSLEIPNGNTNQPIVVDFPHILEPRADKDQSLNAFLTSAEKLSIQPQSNESLQDQSELRKILTASGGVIQFRKTPLRTANDFSAFMHTLAKGTGWQPHVDKGLMVLRRPHADNVATANEGPPTQEIGSHNEYGLSSHYPSYIAFFCLSAPEKGGQTPIASSLRLHNRFKTELNDYLQTITKQGIAFAIHHPRGNVENHIGGNSVFNENAFGPKDKNNIKFQDLPESEKRLIVEENVKSLAREGGWDENASKEDESVPVWKRKGYSGHWMPDGSFLVVQRTPGVRIHPVFKAPSYFTNVHTRFVYAGLHEQDEDKHQKEAKAEASPWRTNLLEFVEAQQKNQTLKPPVQLPPYLVGSHPNKDDFPFSQHWIKENLRITSEEQVNVEWNVGDVLLIDNLAVQHGRKPWEGDRRLLASLWDSSFIQQASRV